MRPTEHRDPSEEELIAHIRQSLKGHEETYVPGAWEKFNNQERKKPVIWLWSLSGVAAALLICVGLFLYTNNAPEKSEGKTHSSIVKNQHPELTKSDPVPADEPTPDKSAELTVAPVKQSARNVIPVQQQTNTKQATSVPISEVIVSKPANQPGVDQPAATTPTRVPAKQKDSSFEALLKKESQALASSSPAKTQRSKADKWELGVMVAPSLGSTRKLNMGYGVSMAFVISNKVSLSSGISYNEMAASKNVSAPVTMGIAKAKDLESTEAKVIGIDIPLEIKYHLSKNVYANVGVSAFAVLNQQRSNTYLEGKIVQNYMSVVDGVEREASFAVKERVVEEAPVESEIKSGRYLGFYNFSVGYKQKISKNNSVSIEPFMKVPMKEVTKENLRMLGTGIRLKFDF